MQDTKIVKASPTAASSGVPGTGWNSLRGAFDLFRKRKVTVLVSFLIVFLALCVCQYLVNTHTAGTILSLDYEEASLGLTPNRTRFNVYEIRSREVMDRLIEQAGLEGIITPEALSECISVKATHDRNISGSEGYISTSFVVRFTSKGVIRNRNAEEMLALLCKTYREYFVEHYGFNHSILSFDVADLQFDDEYLMSVDLLELKCGQLEKYVQLRKRESKNYRDPDTGMTFTALEQRAKNFYTYDIARLRSYIIENGIVNDGYGLNTMLNYKIRMDRLMYNKLIAAYDEDNTGIRLYDTAMSAIIMIPTQDQTMQYYMSRTKTGMDNMALHADAQLLGAAERMEQIEYNTHLTEKLNVSHSDPVLKEKADVMIQEMKTSLEKLAADIQTVDSSYTRTKARDYLTFSDDGTGFAERTGLVLSFLCSALILLAAFFCVFLYRFLSKKKEKKA